MRAITSQSQKRSPCRSSRLSRRKRTVGEPRTEPHHSFAIVEGIENFFQNRLLAECMVHQGFQKALDQIWRDAQKLINEYRTRYPQAEICLTGHSLGAAMATLAVSRFAGGNARCTPLAALASATMYLVTVCAKRATAGVFLFVNGNDLVTHVPIEEPFYNHVDPNLQSHCSGRRYRAFQIRRTR